MAFSLLVEAITPDPVPTESILEFRASRWSSPGEATTPPEQCRFMAYYGEDSSPEFDLTDPYTEAFGPAPAGSQITVACRFITAPSGFGGPWTLVRVITS